LNHYRWRAHIIDRDRVFFSRRRRVTDPTGHRHSLDLLAESTYGAARLFVVEAKQERAAALPTPTLATIFEIVFGGRVHRVAGSALQRWIVERRNRLNGPKGYLFSQRPGLE
jgi:hypothetical protein